MSVDRENETSIDPAFRFLWGLTCNDVIFLASPAAFLVSTDRGFLVQSRSGSQTWVKKGHFLGTGRRRRKNEPTIEMLLLVARPEGDSVAL